MLIYAFDHVTPEDMVQRWRTLGDPVCDDALQTVFSSSASTVRKELLTRLETYAETHPEVDDVHAFLREVSQCSPAGIQVTGREVELAQELQALLHYSLAGGFASPRITRTLQAVSYLLPHSSKSLQKAAHASQRIIGASNERIFIRLLETFQMVLDALDCTITSLQATNTTANAAIDLKDRYLPRMRVLERWRKEGREDPLAMAVPINQEDLSGTLTAFSTLPIWCLHRLHVHPTDEYIRAYLALWRQVGFYLGVDPSIILRHFSAPITADKFVGTTAMHLFSTNNPSDAADPDGLPPASLRMAIRMHAALLLQRIPHWVTHYYPRKGWTVKRRAVLKEGIARSVWWSIGMRRASFRPRTDVKNHADAARIAPGVKEAEAVQPDIADAQRPSASEALRQWREVLADMIVVCVGTGLASLSLGWTVFRFLWSRW
ncbi:uncharacterized protein C8Q71DRAFT_794797 [Rhodofomes roseus]|uniref:ER-bound oxygenase mpaB/mpaB'/Rubber oxygenase catalytic domain-containing protein n=1 Tax=Rhodofomes roseus TaxID=34475 RepID=A0ABQ8KRB1_9APHY|nr:uncharacterized protein C8Q71DRAFT_794797 [Rhodofomes roseus]KAH9840655.1 hypothetical protein C8Q71DRAFT_794797 [Rhodofomes roseus]